MYLCMYVWGRALRDRQNRVHIHTHILSHKHIYTHTYTLIHTYTQIHIRCPIWGLAPGTHRRPFRATSTGWRYCQACLRKTALRWFSTQASSKWMVSDLDLNMYVCMCTYMCVCILICVYVCICAWMRRIVLRWFSMRNSSKWTTRVYVYVCVHICVYLCVYVRVHECLILVRLAISLDGWGRIDMTLSAAL